MPRPRPRSLTETMERFKLYSDPRGRIPVVCVIVFKNVPAMRKWWRSSGMMTDRDRRKGLRFIARFVGLKKRWDGCDAVVLLAATRSGSGTVAHEMFHASVWWAERRGWKIRSLRGEERMADAIDTLVRGYWMMFYRLRLDEKFNRRTVIAKEDTR